MPLKFEYLSLFINIMPSRRERERPCRVPVDEVVVSALHAPPPQGDPQVPSEYPFPPIPQVGFLSPMTIDAFQAFTIYWYA